MAIFTRYARVLEADGSPMPVRSALVEINPDAGRDPGPARKATWTRTPDSASPGTSNMASASAPTAEAEVLFSAKNTSFDGLQRAGVVVGRQGQGPAQTPRRAGPGLESGDGPAHHRLGGHAAPDPLPGPPSGAAGWAKRPASCSAWERSGRRRPARSPTGCTHWPSASGGRTRRTPYNILVTSLAAIQAEAARLAAGVPEQTGFGFSAGEAS